MRYLLCSILALLILTGAWLTFVRSAESAPMPPAPTPETQSEAPDQEDQLDPFVPSEKVPADSAISFPVDI